MTKQTKKPQKLWEYTEVNIKVTPKRKRKTNK